VLVTVNAVGLAVLLAAEDAAILPGEPAVVLAAHVVFLAVDAGFLALQVGRFAGSELAVADALRDAILLVVLALIDCGSGLGEGGR